MLIYQTFESSIMQPYLQKKNQQMTEKQAKLPNIQKVKLLILMHWHL